MLRARPAITFKGVTAAEPQSDARTSSPILLHQHGPPKLAFIAAMTAMRLLMAWMYANTKSGPADALKFHRLSCCAQPFSGYSRPRSTMAWRLCLCLVGHCGGSRSLAGLSLGPAAWISIATRFDRCSTMLVESSTTRNVPSDDAAKSRVAKRRQEAYLHPRIDSGLIRIGLRPSAMLLMCSE